MKSTNDYDAVIIGAGISGLVCGCYLAKAGFKTLIIEQSHQAGGYCTSFVREGYHFDAAAHGLGGLRSNGRMRKIFDDLELNNELQVIRHNPSDLVITPKHNIRIFNSLDQTIIEFQKAFPKERENIERYFSFIRKSSTASLVILRHITLQKFLDSYFIDNELKSIIALFVLGLVGSPPDRVSAVVGCLIFREFLLDGGYYPVGGMQSLPDALVKRLTDYGGEFLPRKQVTKILVKNNRAYGVMINNKTTILSKHIISAADVHQTILNMIDSEFIPLEMEEKINSMTVSMSEYLVFLGVDQGLTFDSFDSPNIWFINNDNIGKIYEKMLRFDNDCLLINISSLNDGLKNNYNRTSIRLESTTPFISKELWNDNHKKQMSDKFILLTEKVIPNLSKHIVLKFTASPTTFIKWTSNFNGSGYGWESTPKQFGEPSMSQKTRIENLYITGHWSNQSSGIAFVANCGYDTADLIIKRAKPI